MNSKNKSGVKSKSMKPKKLTANVPNPLPGLSRDYSEGKQVEEALRESEEKYRMLFETMTQGVVYQTADGKILTANSAAERILGLTFDQMKGRTSTDPRWKAIHEDGSDFPGDTHASMVALSTGKDVHDVVMGVFIPELEDYRWININAVPLFRPGEPAPYQVYTTFEDITERKRVEEALRESEKHYHSLFENMLEGFSYCQMLFEHNKPFDFIYLDVNRAFEELTGLRNVVGKKVSDVIPGIQESNPELFEVYSKVALTGKPERFETYIESMRIWLSISVYSTRERYFVAVFDNITERKLAEEALGESEEKWHSLVSASPDYIALHNPEGRFLFLNHYAEGFSEKDVIGTSVYQYLLPESVELFRSKMEKTLNTLTTQHFELTGLGDGGAKRTYDEYLIPVHSKNQEINIMAVAMDITERKRAEEALRYREGMLQKIFDILPVGLWIADKDGKLLRGNPAGVKIWGAEPKVSPLEYGVFKGRRLPSGEDIAPDDWALVHTIRDKVTIVDELLEIDAFDGKKKTILNYTAPVIDAQGDVQGAIVVNQDITERKRVEEHLAYQANLLSNVNDAVTASDNRFILTAWNRAAENMFGWKSEEVLGRPGKDVFRSEFIDLDRPKVFRRVKETGQFRGEMIQYRKDGTPIYVEANTFAMQNESRQTTGYVTISRDVTERKQAEKELAQSHEQLRALASYWQNTIEAERAHIAREIHDDFGQSMTALKMDLVWLANHLPAGDEKVDRIRGMTTLVDESVALMRRIATDLRPGLLDDLGLNAAMEWQAQEFSRHSGIPCKLNLPEHDLGLDPALNTTLFRIFQETLTNIARHAQATRVSASLKQKLKTLVLTLRDNGRGITESELTNPRSLGLLGLRERAAQWGGETTIHGVAGKGTKVTVRIPFPASPVNGDRR